ncbi:MAG: GNAT family N-acetyltransferase [Actinomycetota bacterium]
MESEKILCLGVSMEMNGSGDAAAAVEANLLAWVDIIGAFEGARVERAGHAARWTSPTQLPLFNGIIGSPDISGTEGVDALLRPYDEGSIPLLWIVPGVDPVLAAELVTRGFDVLDLPGMAMQLAALPDAEAVPGVAVHEVDGDLELLEEATRISLVTNGFPPEAVAPLVAGLMRYPDRRSVRTFLATMDGTPAAASTLLCAAGVAGLYNVGTLEGFRGRGLGRLISLAALRAGHEQDLRMGVLQASPMGEPVYRAIGFEECSRFIWAVRGLPETPS